MSYGIELTIRLIMSFGLAILLAHDNVDKAFMVFVTSMIVQILMLLMDINRKDTP